MKEVIHFAHGNGFPSPCYRQLLERLKTRYDCTYIDKVGHSPQFPVTENWQYLVNEVIESIQSQADKPVIAIGHSLGGVLSLFASIEKPEIFKAVILLDAPMLGRTKSVLIRLSKAFGVIDNLTPASQTRFRRKHWQTRDQALRYLRRRALFKSFDEACLTDYIDYGMVHDDDGYTLMFDPKIEYQIYRTIPHVCYAYEGRLQVPTVLIHGSQSHIIRRTDLRYMKNKFGISTYEIAGTHMFPMEDPALCAAKIFEVIDALLSKKEIN
jgi:pimeloyl-ACP methyl ester carboxylesterase